jgi:hypothetical protein
MPPECGVTDEAGAWRLKALCATRSFCLWLNKGVDALHYFDAYEPQFTSFGVLPVNLKQLPPEAKFDAVATPPMKAVHNLTRAFAGSVPLAKTDPLTVEVTSLGPESKVFDGDATHPPLWSREVLAVLPFQVNPRKHVVVVYVMTRDVTKPFPPATFRLKFTGVKGSRVDVRDAISGLPVTAQSKSLGAGMVEITLPVTDQPSIIAIE